MEPFDLHASLQEAFNRLSPVIAREHQPDEKPFPVTMPADDMERLAFPGEDQVGEVSGGMRSYMEEVRAYHREINEFFRALTLETLQSRMELNDIRSYLERYR